MNLLTQSAKAKLSAWLCNSEFKLNFKIPLVNDTQHIVMSLLYLSSWKMVMNDIV